MAITFGGVDYTNGKAEDIIKAILKPYGLENLAAGMYQAGKDSDNDPNVAYLWLRQQPQYQQAFPGMAIREQNKLDPIDEETYNQWRSQMRATMQAHGIPSGFYDDEGDFAKFIGGDVSPKEVEDRVVKGVVAARQAPQDVRDMLFEYYGIDEGRLAAYWIDPTPGRGDALLREQAATYAGAAARRAGFAGGINRQEAETLAAYGKDPNELEQGFGALARGEELLSAQAGENFSTMTREEQLKYAAGGTAQAAELQRRATQRKAQFAGGGGYADTVEGIVGLGSSK